MINIFKKAKHKLYLIAVAFRERQNRRKKIKGYSRFDDGLIEKTNLQAKELISRRPAKFFFNSCNKIKLAEDFGKFFSKEKDRVIKQADQACEHKFDLLGSGLIDLGRKINWHQDFRVKISWPMQYYQDLEIVRNDGSDIKVPWELSRFQHLSILGQAYLLTKKDKYIKEYITQINDWIDENPCPYGVNWRPMEVALRTINWIWGYYFFEGDNSLNREFLARFIKSLIKHGRFIFDNLENRGKITSNHYLSDIVGLIYLGVFLKHIPEAKRWLSFSVIEIEKEIQKQVFPDGVDFEASISYHRLVVELFIHAANLLEISEVKLSPGFWQRLERMIDFTAHYTKPNGLAPQIGDADNGRVITLLPYDWRDHRFVLTWGAIKFRRSNFAIHDYIPELWWFIGEKGYDIYQKLNKQKVHLKSKNFEEGGVTVMRDNNNFMIIDHGRVGQGGNGGHSHNDLFSFEFFAGRDIVIDPGSYVYTGDVKERNRFRSTSYHNTLEIDNTELNDFVHTFKVHERSVPDVIKKHLDKDYDLLSLKHYGYKILKDPVICQRDFYFGKRDRIWIIRDTVSGKKVHKIKTHFHVGTNGVQINKHVVFINNGIFLYYQSKNKISAKVVKSWVSKSYGVKSVGRKIDFFSNAQLPYSTTYIFSIKQINHSHLQKALNKFEKRLKK